MSDVKIEAGWKSILENVFAAPTFNNLTQFIKAEINSGKTVYPPGALIFNAFDTTPFDEVKVVVLGQDPYINSGEAMGLSFSVPANVRIPPSLRNIYKELHTDIGMEIPKTGDLTNWAKQGVFLLNAVLTVEKGRSRSHAKHGWEEFTDAVIKKLSDNRENLVFMLWGNFAKSKKVLIDTERHLVLEAAHPSPLAGGAFFGSRHFSKANEYLESKGIKPIDWGAIV